MFVRGNSREPIFAKIAKFRQPAADFPRKFQRTSRFGGPLFRKKGAKRLDTLHQINSEALLKCEVVYRIPASPPFSSRRSQDEHRYRRPMFLPLIADAANTHASWQASRRQPFLPTISSSRMRSSSLESPRREMDERDPTFCDVPCRRPCASSEPLSSDETRTPAVRRTDDRPQSQNATFPRAVCSL